MSCTLPETMEEARKVEAISLFPEKNKEWYEKRKSLCKTETKSFYLLFDIASKTVLMVWIKKKNHQYYDLV